MLSILLSLFNPLAKALKLIENNVDNETERQRIKEETVQKAVDAQVSVIGQPNWILVAMPFVLPLAIYWCSVIFYSILFCKGCVYAKEWTIAALPPVFMDWAGWVIGSIFLYKGFETLVNRTRR